MQEDLAKVEDEKKKLLDEFALRTSDLDARKSTIIESCRSRTAISFSMTLRLKPGK